MSGIMNLLWGNSKQFLIMGGLEGRQDQLAGCRAGKEEL
jgi:hypothetical protein